MTSPDDVIFLKFSEIHGQYFPLSNFKKKDTLVFSSLSSIRLGLSPKGLVKRKRPTARLHFARTARALTGRYLSEFLAARTCASCWLDKSIQRIVDARRPSILAGLRGSSLRLLSARLLSTLPSSEATKPEAPRLKSILHQFQSAIKSLITNLLSPGSSWLYLFTTRRARKAKRRERRAEPSKFTCSNFNPMVYQLGRRAYARALNRYFAPIRLLNCYCAILNWHIRFQTVRMAPFDEVIRLPHRRYGMHISGLSHL